MNRQVSVVMAVYNGAADLPVTIDSVLNQQGVDFEFIIVDDGSNDETPRILADYAGRDERIRVITQDNQGLTRALIRGCAEARGAYIARQDVGDVSLPGRLAAQVGVLDQDDVVLVGCNYRLVTERGERLHDGIDDLDGDKMTRRLRQAADDVTGPHHGTAMFRRAAYERAGGYRAAFYYAQDIDLWLRLVAHGRIAFVLEVLCDNRFSVDSLSGLNHVEQDKLRACAVAAARRRQAGEPEDDVLAEAARIQPGTDVRALPMKKKRAQSAYFIGSCLAAHGEKAARRYFRQAVRNDPTHFRAWLKLVMGWPR